MNDRERYDRDDPLLGAMFAASRAELPSPRVVEKTIAAVSGAAGLLSAAAAAQAATSTLAVKKTASTIGLALLAKWTGVGLGAGLLTAGAAGVAEHWVAPPATTLDAPIVHVATRSAVRPVPSVPEPHASAVRAAPTAPREPERPSSPLATVSNTRDGEPTARAAFEDAPGPLPTSASRGDALSPELVCIDGARAALGAGNFGEALARSERCEREHPRGRLALEALLIRMHALEGMGQSAAARGAAQRLIALAPKSPHAARARALLDARRENSVIDSPPSGDNGSRRP